MLAVDQKRCHLPYEMCNQTHAIEFRNEYFVVDQKLCYSLSLSKRSTRTKVSGLSVASHHLWAISTKASVVPVPVPAKAPKLPFVNLRSYHVVDPASTIASKTFANIGVSDMLRMSFSSEPGGCFFGTGTTVAVFQRSGILPSLSEQLKIAVTGAANRCA